MVRCCLDSTGGGLSSTRKIFGGKYGTGLSGTAPGHHWSPLRPRQSRKGRIQMRRRITKAFFATAAAGATITTLGLAAASPAGAAASGRHHHFTGTYFTPTGGTPIPTAANCVTSSPVVPSDNCSMAGYQASGRTFRFAQALITVPNHICVVDPDSTTTEPDAHQREDRSQPVRHHLVRHHPQWLGGVHCGAAADRDADHPRQ